MAGIIKLKILRFDYTHKRRQCEDGAERDLKMLALKIGVVWPYRRNAGSHQKLEKARNFSLESTEGGQAF